MYDWLLQIDKDLFLLINGLHNESLDFIMWWTSKKITWIPFYIFISYLIIKKFKKQGLIFLLFAGLLIALSDLSSVHLFKNVFQRYRPCHNEELKGIVNLVNNKCGGRYGFVSSHAANMFAIASYVFFILRRHYKWFAASLFLWAAFIAYSRVYLGVHYPSDIAAGALLGIVCGLIVYLLASFVANKFSKAAHKN